MSAGDLWQPEHSRQKLRRPARRWRNQWYARDACMVLEIIGGWYQVEPGSWLSRRVFPSKDTAETDAARSIERNASIMVELGIQYQGAVEDGSS